MVNLRFLLFALCASFAAIRSARLYVEHGASKALWCGEECAYKDPKHFVWRGPYGRELSLGSQQYTVSNFSEGKAGNYTCEWMDMLCSQYTLDLQVPGYFDHTKALAEQHFCEKEDAVVRSGASLGIPPATLRWTNGSKLLQAFNSTDLLISSAAVEDSGTYTCYLVCAVGDGVCAERQVTVEVHPSEYGRAAIYFVTEHCNKSKAVLESGLVSILKDFHPCANNLSVKSSELTCQEQGQGLYTALLEGKAAQKTVSTFNATVNSSVVIISGFGQLSLPSPAMPTSPPPGVSTTTSSPTSTPLPPNTSSPCKEATYCYLLGSVVLLLSVFAILMMVLVLLVCWCVCNAKSKIKPELCQLEQGTIPLNNNPSYVHHHHHHYYQSPSCNSKLQTANR